MENNKQTQYDEFYKKNGANVHTDPLRFGEIAKLCKGAVLDLACGTGDLADFYKGEYVGVDISQEAINLADKMKRKNARFLRGDILSPNVILSRTFKTIVLAEFFEHLQNDTFLIERLLQISEKGTRWIITVPNYKAVPDPDHYQIFTVPEMRKKFSQYGKVQFYNYGGFRERILMTVEFGFSNSNDLSLVMIVKDEEKGLETSILSCINFVDKIVISVDSKSTDKTLDIVNQYADVVLVHEWQNSFAKARNTLLPYLTTKWALCIDGHEYIKKTGDISTALLKDVEALNVKITMEDLSSFVFPRIIRSQIKWFADVHNYPVLKTWADFFDFEIVHDREHLQTENSTKERDKQRSQMIFSILVDNFKKDKKDSRALYYLGQQCMYEKRWNESKKWYKKFLKIGTVKGERWTAFYSLGICCANLNQRFRSLWYFFKADKIMPNRWEVCKRIGATYMSLGLNTPACIYLVKALERQEGNFSNYPEPRDDAETFDFLGRCLFNLGKHSEAKIAWTRAVELEQSKEKTKILEDRLKALQFLLKTL